MKIELVPPVHANDMFARRGEPVRVGVPLAQGVCADPADVVLSDGAGRSRPVQACALDRHSDGSVRWLLVDFQADHDGAARPCSYELAFIAGAPAATSSIRASADRGGVSVDTGCARFRLSERGCFPFDEVLIDGNAAIDPNRTCFELEDAESRRHAPAITRVEVEESGPLRVVVRVEGRVGRGRRAAAIVARLHFFAASAVVQFDITIRNPRRAAHRGGFWELGDSGSMYVRDASFTFALPPATRHAAPCCSPEAGAPVEPLESAFELYQDSSGGANWTSQVHVNRLGAFPLTFAGYRLRTPASETFGRRATPIGSVGAGARRVSVTMPQFWENFPKALEADGETVTLRLFPRQHADAHELQGGEQKTHLFFVAFGSDSVSDVPLNWARSPLLARATPDHYAESGAMPYLIPVTHAADAAHEELIGAAITGDDTFVHKRERIDEYGWRHFGELYADHEAVAHAGPAPMISHYNNQYDGVAGFACQWMRSGDPRWWRLCSDLAQHVRDVDIYHTDQDKSAYNHGLFWHTFHYVDAGLATHRGYPRAKGVGGGGPSNEHNYSTGLMIHFFLTGDRASRDAVLDLARWVIARDDGRLTIFRWLSRTDTGHSSSTAFPWYHGPGRGGGNSIVALLNGYRVSGDPTFLRKSEALIRRCIHPADDVGGRDLLDAERKWSYTVFLCALGRYLDDKAERGEVDDMYGYARQSLLLYAHWMVLHEHPYLERPERLEYPTETWAAQELWKSDALSFAAKYATGADRAHFAERADFFLRYSTATLAKMATRALTRPLVLLLSHGYMSEYLRLHPRVSGPVPPAELRVPAVPPVFVPQKERAKRRFLVLTAGLALLVLTFGLLYLGCG